MSRYDQATINKIVDYMRNGDFYGGLKTCMDYLNNYPNDDFGRIAYFSLLLRLGRIEEARDYYDHLNKNDIRMQNHINSLCFAYAKLLLLEEKYEECLNFLLSVENIFKVKNDYYYAIAFCKTKLGLKSYADFNDYKFKQLINYSEEEALNKINFYREPNEKNNFRAFSAKIDINNLYKIIKSKLSESYRYYPNLFYYNCVFKALDCGSIQGKSVDYIYVYGIINSDNIINMLPSDNETSRHYIDITTDLITDDISVKRLSQIDKFNQRYKKNTSL